MEPRNPYAPPSAFVHDVVDVQPAGREDTLAPDGRVRPAGSGVEWIAVSWRLFKERPGLWILAVLLGYGAIMAASLIPWVNLAILVVGPLLSAGFAALAHAVHREESVGLGRLFVGFQRGTSSLLLVGLAHFALWAACIGVFVLIDGSIWLEIAAGTGDPFALQGRLPLLFGYMVATILIGLFIAFAPILVVLNGLPPLAAMRMSFLGCLKNILPGLVCLITFVPILILSVLPLGLGLLITFPLLIITIYSAYRDIFLVPAAE
jgi:uncharacterized membrane protein